MSAAVIAVVGAGGKTSLIHRLAGQERAAGRRVLVTTTTKMYAEPDTLVTDDPALICAALTETGYCMAGTPAAGEREKAKIGPLSPQSYAAACRCAEMVLVEADGARHKAVKYPGEQEPVIPENTTRIVVVCGLHGLGQTIAEAAHRPELVCRCLAAEPETRLTAHHIYTLVQKGYVIPLQQKYPEAKIEVCAAHDGSLYQRAVVGLLAAGMDPALLKKEWFEPRPSLLVCGGGHVALEVARLAAQVGLRVRVMDDRPEFANRERFPMAEEVICDSFENLARYAKPDQYNVVLTRGHQHDLSCVRVLLGQPNRYLGMMGSRLKVERTLANLRAEGVAEEKIAELHAPIGLAIGAATPAEIAVSILAQIIQVKSSRSSASASAELIRSTAHGMLCIILEKHGSTPRDVGSMMLVCEDGETVLDSIGGGTIEFAAIRDARGGETTIREYRLTKEEGAGLGMVCGGRNKVLFVPV